MILGKFTKTIQKYALFGEKEKILIAYSGGVDSTGLLELLLELQKGWSLELFLAHFNHKLRKKAEEEEKFVREKARKCSLPIFVESRDVSSYARAQGMNLEEAGRRLRYDFLQKTAGEVGAARIATGHTMSDQAETFLMRLMRGSGLRGLAGIFPVVEGIIVRPLIEIEREEIDAYLRGKEIKFCIDQSNFDRRFLRNRIRMDLLPYIRENFEPGIVSRLGKIAAVIREEDRALDIITREKSWEAVIRKNGAISLKSESLSSLPLGLRRRVVRDFITELRGNLRAVSFEDIESILGLGEGKELTLRRDCILRNEQGLISLRKKSFQKVRYEYLWPEHMLLEIKEIGLKFKGSRIRKKAPFSLNFDDSGQAFLDAQRVRFPLLVRSRREGDRYQPFGAPGRKKLKEIMRSRGIPPSERDRHPVFLSEGEIVWVLGLPVSERFKVRKGTKDVFVIQKT